MALGGGPSGGMGAGNLPDGGQQPSSQLANAGNMNNRQMLGQISRATTPFDFGRFFGGMPPAAQQRFGQNFNVLDKLPMHDQLNWWANTMGPQSWTHIINAIGEGRGLQQPTAGGTLRSDQTELSPQAAPSVPA